MIRPFLRFDSFLVWAFVAGIQPASAQQDAANLGTRLMADAVVKTAVDAIRAAEPQTLEDQVRLCEVEAPRPTRTFRDQ